MVGCNGEKGESEAEELVDGCNVSNGDDDEKRVNCENDKQEDTFL